VRGILLDDFGIDHRAITWVTEEDAHVQEYRDPPNVVRIEPGRDLKTMLLSGEIDAAVALTGLDETAVRTVIPHADAAAAEWYRRTHAYPVNHVVCVKTALLQEHPELGAELMRLFDAAKTAAREPSAEAKFQPIVGADPLPYGLEANRTGIEFCLRYAAEQGLVPRVYAPEELFYTGD
jgi:4,5-dihydroxyphthalate decarboxylase